MRAAFLGVQIVATPRRCCAASTQQEMLYPSITAHFHPVLPVLALKQAETTRMYPVRAVEARGPSGDTFAAGEGRASPCRYLSLAVSHNLVAAYYAKYLQYQHAGSTC